MSDPFRRYRGRAFSSDDIEAIRRLIAEQPQSSRNELARQVCQTLGWRGVDGRLKEMSCRDALLRMEQDGLVVLPERHADPSRFEPPPPPTWQVEPESPDIIVPCSHWKALRFEQVRSRLDSRLWNEYIDDYHYLGDHKITGAQLRYFVYDDDQLLALLGFGAAAWKVAPRDHFIGWSEPQRQRNLHRVANNARFLILPWIRSRNLASRLLGLVCRRLPDDWQHRYGYRVVLLETFVETPRFRGTCYKAANWIEVGTTQGRGKYDRTNKAALPQKNTFVYPLTKDFRNVLCS